MWVLFTAADVWTTTVGLAAGGVEVSPLSARICAAAGPPLMMAVGVLACAVLAAAPLLPWPGRVLPPAVWTVCGLALATKVAVVVSNLQQLWIVAPSG